MSDKSEDIVYEQGDYFVLPADGKEGFEIWKSGITHATRCGVIGWEGQKGVDRAKIEIERRVLKL